MMLRTTTLLGIALGLALGTLSLHAQFRPGHQYALTTEQVAPALSHSFAVRGIEISASQITLPASVVATDPEPALEVRSIEPIGRLASNQSGEVSSAVKLICKQPHTCVPFYAIVTLPAGTQAPTPSPLAGGSLQLVKAAIRQPQTPADFVVRAGAHATLMMEDGSSHIRLEVITLENGAPGKTIRVSSVDHKHNYKAEVVSAGLLKGSF